MCIQIKEEKVNCTEGRETSGRRQYLNDLPWSWSLLLESDRIKNQVRSLVDLSTPTKKRKSKDRIDLKCLLVVPTYVSISARKLNCKPHLLWRYFHT